MRKYFFFIGFVLFSISCFSQYKIVGQIENHGGRILLLAFSDVHKCDTIGNVVSGDGSFDFSGTVREPMAAEIYAVNTKVRIPIFIENQEFLIHADAESPMDYIVRGGGELQKKMNDFYCKKIELNHMRDSLTKEYIKTYGLNDSFGRLQVRGVHDRMDELYSKMEDEFIKENDNMVSADLIARRINVLIRNKTLPHKYALLGENARSTIRGRWMKPFVDKVSKIVVGGIAPNIVMRTPDGDSISIYDIKAKFKILDFWASWCGPCRAEGPCLRSIYSKYNSLGLEIVGISLDTKMESWQNAIQQDQLFWKHISDLKGWNSVAAELYGIHAIPHLFVLDQDNKIVAEGLRGKKLEEFIAEIFENKPE